jgi:hypothetical protein
MEYWAWVGRSSGRSQQRASCCCISMGSSVDRRQLHTVLVPAAVSLASHIVMTLLQVRGHQGGRRQQRIHRE